MSSSAASAAEEMSSSATTLLMPPVMSLTEAAGPNSKGIILIAKNSYGVSLPLSKWMMLGE
jgi:hypothetical protein